MKKRYMKPDFEVVNINTHRHLLILSGETIGSHFFIDEIEDPENAL